MTFCSNAAVIGNVELLLAVLYPDSLSDAVYGRLSNAFLVGMIIGMLLFGVVVDQLGRKTGAVATTTLLVLGIALSAAATGSGTNKPAGMFWMLIVARGIAGVGAGGEYPVSGAGAAEATDESHAYRKRRGFMFAMLSDLSASLGCASFWVSRLCSPPPPRTGWSLPALVLTHEVQQDVWGGLVPLLLLLCVHQRVDKYDIVWRASFALGLVPPLVIFWFRLKMAVSTAYRKSALRRQKMPVRLAAKRYYRPLVGCAATWFLYNYISVPFGVFSATIVARANPGGSLVKNLGWGVVVNCFYLPGPFVGGYLSDKIGRRRTMALGFGLQAALGFVLGGAMYPVQDVFPLFVVLYGVFLTLGEVGPGSTVVLTASECFPTSIRGQAMGFVSAWSKAGAAIGTQVFTSIQGAYASGSGDSGDASKGNQVAFLIGSAFAVVGALMAMFVIPDVSRRLDDDDEAWKKYLAENGWEANWGDQETKNPSGVVLDQRAS